MNSQGHEVCFVVSGLVNALPNGRQPLSQRTHMPTQPTAPWIRWFSETSIADIPLVGGKNASLGEMVRELASRGVRVPNGFSITAAAYWHFLSKTGTDAKVRAILDRLKPDDVESLRECGQTIRHTIVAAELPSDLQRAIVDAYDILGGDPELSLDVAVRSSATAEDLPDASFAGQQETYLNVRGRPQLLETCKRCFASLFTDRAISYRRHKGFDDFKIGLSIGVQCMVRSDLATSGVMFSIDTETGFRNAVLINAAYGLGENVVQGAVNPDEYLVFKPTLAEGFRPILQKRLGNKEFKLIYDIGGGIPAGKTFKAAQIGGPSGGCIPAAHLHPPMDYESLGKLGAIMGSGGLIVMDEDSCMVDVARFFLEFVQEESCGKCGPCRAGTVQMHELLNKILQKQVKSEERKIFRK